MSNGASEIDIDTNPLVRSIGTDSLWTVETVTYRFETGGNSYTDAWGRSQTATAFTVTEKQWIRDIFEKVSAVADLNFQEVPFVNASLDLIKEDYIGAGIGGYAFLPFGNSSSVVLDDNNITDSVVPIHEIGHALGLEHPFSGQRLPGVANSSSNGEYMLNNNLYTVMAYNFPRLNEEPGLGLDSANNLGSLDIAALQAMYGANQTYETGDNTYKQPDEIRSIWDAGGTDKIDFRTETASSVINLNAATLEREPGGGGMASYVKEAGAESLDGVYTIAYGVVIENAYGGSGNDEITGNAAANILSGGAGEDQIFGNDGNDRIRGGADDDYLSGGGDNDLLRGQSGNDTLYGNYGNDILLGESGGDVLSGGQGIDRAQYSTSSDGVVADLQNASINTGDAAGDTYISIERLSGSAFNDNLRGDDVNNHLWGQDGDDKLYGRLGDDNLYGGNGNDLLTGGFGNDRMRGGEGADTFVFLKNNGNDTIFDYNAAEDDLRIIGTGLDYADLTITDGADRAIIDYGTGIIAVWGVSSTALDEDEFSFI